MNFNVKCYGRLPVLIFQTKFTKRKKTKQKTEILRPIRNSQDFTAQQYGQKIFCPFKTLPVSQYYSGGLSFKIIMPS